MVPLADLDAFLSRLRQRGRPVDRPGDGMLNVIEASEVVRWPVIDIVRLVLDGDLSRIELLPSKLKFRSVLVDPEEVRVAKGARQAKGGSRSPRSRNVCRPRRGAFGLSRRTATGTVGRLCRRPSRRTARAPRGRISRSTTWSVSCRNISS
jgi:hypothetical protein